MAVGYWVLARLGSDLFFRPGTGVSLLWPASGFALAAAARLRGRERLLVPAAILVADLPVELAFETHVSAALGVTAANMAEPLVAVAVVERITRRPPAVESVPDVLALLAAATLGNAVTALLGASAVAADTGGPWPAAYGAWWFGDGTGMLTVAPALLALTSPRGRGRSRPDGLVGAVAGAVLAWIVFWHPVTTVPVLSRVYAIIPLLLLAGLRTSTRVRGAALLAVAVITAAGGASGRGPFAQPGDTTLADAFGQWTFLLLTTLCTLGTGALLRDERRARRALSRELAERRRSEAERDRLAAVVRDARDAVITRDLDGRILDGNPAAERLYGYARAELVGAPFDRLVPPGRREQEAAAVARVRDGEVGFSYDTERLRRDGEALQVSVTISPVRDAGGRLLAVSTSARDVSGAARDAARLALSEARFRGLLSAAPDVILGVAHDGTIAFASDRAADVLGYAPEELVGHPVDVLVPEAYPALLGALDPGRPDPEGTDLLARRKDGSEVPVEVSLGAPASDGAHGLTTVILVDVSARRAAAADQALLASIVSATADAVLTIDRDHRIASFNPAAERLFGVAAEEVLGRPVDAVGDGSGSEARRERLDRVLEDGVDLRFTTALSRRDGIEMTFDVTLSPVRAADGSVVAAAAVVRDVTADRQARSAAQRLAAVVEASADAMFVVDRDGLLRDANPAAERLFGFDRDAVHGRPLPECCVPLTPHAAAVQAGRLAGALAGEVQRYEGRRRRLGAEGGVIDVATQMSPIRAADGQVRSVSVVARDVTAERAAERRRRRTEARARTAARLSEELIRSLDVRQALRALTGLVVGEVADVCGVVVLDAQGRYRDVEVGSVEDPAAAALARVLGDVVGRRPEFGPVVEVLRQGRATLSAGFGPGHPAALVDDEALRRAAMAFEAASTMVVPIPGPGGRPRGAVTFASASTVYDEDDLAFAQDLADRAGQALDNALLHRDAVHARRRADDAAAGMRRAEARFRAAFEQAPIGIMLLRLDGPRRWIVEANEALTDITGRTVEELVGLESDELIAELDRPLADSMMRELASGRTPHHSVELRFEHLDGHEVWVNARVAEVEQSSDDPSRLLVCQVQDVTEAREAEHRLRHLADHDPLTGLFNRRRFGEELRRALAQARRYREALALLVIDLDNFKYVNDTYGHALGDDVLVRLADALRTRSRDSDVVGRLGGDEFAVLLPNSDAAAARAAAGGLLEEIRRSVCVHAEDGSLVQVTASIGVRPVDADAMGDDDTLLMDADVAMYDAKETGRDRVSVAGQGSAGPEKIRARLSWSQRIRAALERPDGFCLYEQPILGLRSGLVEHAEVLLRMQGPGDGDLIDPGRFLYIAERFGLIGEIDKWVIGQAVDLLGRRQAAGLDLGLHVNLSGRSIGDRRVMDFISSTVRNAPVDPRLLTFEVTETAAIIDMDHARELSRQLASVGCRLALDDFGSGFGSFYYLKHLPFDTVKIDGGFVRELPDSPTDQLVVRSIAEISRGMGKQTVAEFVQDAAAARILSDLRVDFAQGHHVGRAVPVELTPAYLRAA